jgi:hypothetical protein
LIWEYVYIYMGIYNTWPLGSLKNISSVVHKWHQFRPDEPSIQTAKKVCWLSAIWSKQLLSAALCGARFFDRSSYQAASYLYTVYTVQVSDILSPWTTPLISFLDR